MKDLTCYETFDLKSIYSESNSTSPSTKEVWETKFVTMQVEDLMDKQIKFLQRLRKNNISNYACGKWCHEEIMKIEEIGAWMKWFESSNYVKRGKCPVTRIIKRKKNV